jgi:hypothetical protein
MIKQPHERPGLATVPASKQVDTSPATGSACEGDIPLQCSSALAAHGADGLLQSRLERVLTPLKRPVLSKTNTSNVTIHEKKRLRLNPAAVYILLNGLGIEIRYMTFVE